MCSKGVPAALVGCSVGVEGVSDCCRAVGAVANVRRAGNNGIGALLAKARAKEQLGQTIVKCVGVYGRYRVPVEPRTSAVKSTSGV
jgi:hypothetical protein